MIKKYKLSAFRFNKIKRILQGLIGIILMILFHKYILLEYLQVSIITKIIITILLVISFIIVAKVLKNEIVQFILSFRYKECVIDIEKEWMLYNWEGLGGISEYRVNSIKYIEYNGDKIVVQVGDNGLTYDGG